MRIHKHKHTKRALDFYRIKHGFREPYKVILDGNFVAAVLDMRMGDPAELLRKLLKAPVKLYVTRCSLLELKAKGKEYAEAYRAAKRVELHLNCHHDEQPLPGWECLKSCVGDRNEEHFFVATQERLLRAQLGRVHGGASLFVSVNGAHLEAPSDWQREGAQKEDVATQVVPQAELQAPALESLPQLQSRPQGHGRSIYRRKGAKGPNPLSVQKKKPKDKKKGVGPGAKGGAGGGRGGGLEGRKEQAGGEGGRGQSGVGGAGQKGVGGLEGRREGEENAQGRKKRGRRRKGGAEGAVG